MREVRSAGGSVSFDPNLRPSLFASREQMISTINRLASLAHWVLPGLDEGRLLSGCDAPADIASFYLQRGVDVGGHQARHARRVLPNCHDSGSVPAA